MLSGHGLPRPAVPDLCGHPVCAGQKALVGFVEGHGAGNQQNRHHRYAPFCGRYCSAGRLCCCASLTSLILCAVQRRSSNGASLGCTRRQSCNLWRSKTRGSPSRCVRVLFNMMAGSFHDRGCKVLQGSRTALCHPYTGSTGHIRNSFRGSGVTPQLTLQEVLDVPPAQTRHLAAKFCSPDV